MTFYSLFSQSRLATSGLLVLLLLSLNSLAAGTTGTLPQATAVIRASGFHSLISQLPSHFEAGLEHGAALAGQPQQQAQLQTLARRSLENSDVPQQMAEAVSKALTAEELLAILRWYQSDTGRKINQAQMYAASEQGFAEMMGQANQVLTSPELLQLAELLDKQLGLVEFMVDMQEHQQLAKYSTLSGINGEPFALPEFRQQMQQQRKHMVFNAEQLVSMSLGFALRDFSAAELQAYEHFLQQPVTQLYLKAAMHGLAQARQQMVQHWLQGLSTLQPAAE